MYACMFTYVHVYACVASFLYSIEYVGMYACVCMHVPICTGICVFLGFHKLYHSLQGLQ